MRLMFDAYSCGQPARLIDVTEGRDVVPVELFIRNVLYMR
jgi:hypothetical protein